MATVITDPLLFAFSMTKARRFQTSFANLTVAEFNSEVIAKNYHAHFFVLSLAFSLFRRTAHALHPLTMSMTSRNMRRQLNMGGGIGSFIVEVAIDPCRLFSRHIGISDLFRASRPSRLALLHDYTEGAGRKQMWQ